MIDVGRVSVVFPDHTLCCRLCFIYPKQNRSGVGKLSTAHDSTICLCRNSIMQKHPIHWCKYIIIYHYISVYVYIYVIYIYVLYIYVYPYIYIYNMYIYISHKRSPYPHCIPIFLSFFGGRSWGISCVAKTLCCVKRSVCSRRIGHGSEPMKFPYDWGINIHYPLVMST